MNRKASQESFEAGSSSSIRRPAYDRLLRMTSAQSSPVGAKLHLRSNSSGSGGALSTLMASNTASPVPSTTLKDILQSERSFAASSVSSPSGTFESVATRTGHGRMGSGSNVTSLSRPSNVRELLEDVDDTETEKFIKITSAPLNMDKLPMQISEVLQPGDGHTTPSTNASSVVSPETEALSFRLKEQFEKKYQVINSVTSSGKEDARYNPLETIRRRQDDKRNKIVRKAHRRAQSTPKALESSTAIITSQSVSAATSVQPSPVKSIASREEQKKPWSFLFTNKRKGSSVVANPSPIVAVASDTRRSSGEKLNKSSSESMRQSQKSSKNRLLESPEGRLLSSPDSILSPGSVSMKRANTSGSDSESHVLSSTGSSALSPPTQQFSRDRRNSFTPRPIFGRKEESAPATQVTSPAFSDDKESDTIDELGKPRNMTRIRHKLKGLRKSGSMDVMDLASDRDHIDDFRTLKHKRTSKGVLEPSPGERARKLLMGKQSNNSMRENDEIMRAKISANLKVFESILQSQSPSPGTVSTVVGSEYDVSDYQKSSLINLGISYGHGYSERKVELRNDVIIEGAIEHCQSQWSVFETATAEISNNSRSHFDESVSELNGAMSLLQKRDQFLSEIHDVSRELQLILDEDVKEMTRLQLECDRMHAASMYKLVELTDKVNNNLVPELDYLKTTSNDELLASRVRKLGVAEWRYTLLAVLLNAVASIFWMFSVTMRKARRLLGIETAQTAQSTFTSPVGGVGMWPSDLLGGSDTDDGLAGQMSLRTRRSSLKAGLSATSTSPSKDEDGTRRRRTLKQISE